jgi:hypothetical protein
MTRFRENSVHNRGGYLQQGRGRIKGDSNTSSGEETGEVECSLLERRVHEQLGRGEEDAEEGIYGKITR